MTVRRKTASIRRNAASIDPVRTKDGSRAHILAAALSLLTADGRDAVTTRAVALAAGVQPPVLYRLFGDKDALLGALAEYGFAQYLSQKQSLPLNDDPVEALRAGWDLHLNFGLSQPALYHLMYVDPKPDDAEADVDVAAAGASFAMLRRHIRNVATVGRLRVNEERAASYFHAACLGTVLTLLRMPHDKRDMTLSHMAREAALAAIIAVEPVSLDLDSTKAAIALRAVLGDAGALSRAERALLIEWLDRLSA